MILYLQSAYLRHVTDNLTGIIENWKHNLRVERSTLDYVRIARAFFSISSERNGVILYSRCNFSTHAHGAIHCFVLKYPQQEKRSWDAIVTRISLSLQPLEG
jgi:hypothetical protein